MTAPGTKLGVVRLPLLISMLKIEAVQQEEVSFIGIRVEIDIVWG
jgi:hypothetical protein